MLDFYTDVAFATIVQKEGMTSLWGVSVASIVIMMIPKVYAMALNLALMCHCIRQEDKKRKYAHRMLILNEYRLLAHNVEYTNY